MCELDEYTSAWMKCMEGWKNEQMDWQMAFLLKGNKQQNNIPSLLLFTKALHKNALKEKPRPQIKNIHTFNGIIS